MRYKSLITIVATVASVAGCSLFDDAVKVEIRELAFSQTEVVVPADPADGSELEFTLKVFANGNVSITEIGGTSEWIGLDRNSLSGDGSVLFICRPNDSYRRMAKFLFILEGTSKADTVYVRQDGIRQYVDCATPYLSVDGRSAESSKFPINTNVPLEQLLVSTDYITEGTGWIDNPSFEGDDLVVGTSYNPSSNPRKASVSLTYTDGWNEDLKVVLYVTQSNKDGDFGVPVTFDRLREIGSPEGKTISEDLILSGVVISDYHSRNMDENLNVDYNVVDTTMSLRTAYLQDFDASQGVRLVFDEVKDNLLLYGTGLKVNLNGLTVTRLSSPDRVTVSGLSGANMVDSYAGAPVVPKERSLASLTDRDLYTFVTLKNMEFASKLGTYADCYENYTLASPVSSVNDGNNDRMDNWGTILVDDAGDAIFAPVNMLCLWRRSGRGVPQGVGDLKGVLVHNVMHRYGNVGDYQLRVLDESGYAMPWEASSSYTDFLTWNAGGENVPAEFDNTKVFSTYYSTINTRYKHNGLNTIVPSDDLGAGGSTVAMGEFFNENKTKGSGTAEIRYYYDHNRLTAHERGRSANYKVIHIYGVNAKGWYNFDSERNLKYKDDGTADSNGVRMEFSTSGITAQKMLLSFCFSAGRISGSTSKTFPAHWCVEYSVDDGATYTLVKESGTEADYIHLHSLPWWDVTINSYTYYTSVNCGIGHTYHAFCFGQDIFDKEKVIVRIRPYDEVLTALPTVWNGSGETAYVTDATSYDNYISFGSIKFSYR